jgi:hypothetical protein
MNRVKKRELLAVIEDAGLRGVTKADLFVGARVDPECEATRPRMWSVSQGLAELLNTGDVIEFRPGQFRVRGITA